MQIPLRGIPMIKINRPRMLCVMSVLAASWLTANAQIGSGWSQYWPSKSYSGWSQSSRYSISGSTEHFWNYLSDPMPVGGSGPRSEWHVNNNYSRGSHQFQ